MTSGKVATTVGYERRTNPSLRFREEASFVEHMLRDQPPRPANMKNVVAINQGSAPYSDREPTPRPLDAAQAWALLESGQVAVDTRGHDAFAREHVPGALNVNVDGQAFEQNVGWILPDRSFVLVVENSRAAARALHKLAFVGLERHALGFVEIEAWRAAGLVTQSMQTIDVDELRRALQDGRRKLLDVRERGEWEAGHIAGSIHVSFRHLPERLAVLALGKAEPIALICAAGIRSSTAFGILRTRGHENVVAVAGGLNAWIAAGLPVLRGS